MTTRRSNMSKLRTALAAALLVLACGAVFGQKTEPVARYRAVAASLNLGKASQIDIVIERWSTDQERQQLLTTLQEFGRDKLIAELMKIRPRCGYMRLPNTRGYDLFYARDNVLPDGNHHVVLATNRSVGVSEAATATRSLEYQLTLIELHLDKEGEGEGKLVPAGKITWDNAKKTIEIENWGALPVDLKGVKSVKP